VGGPVPDLVNALDLSKNSARAYVSSTRKEMRMVQVEPYPVKIRVMLSRGWQKEGDSSQFQIIGTALWHSQMKTCLQKLIDEETTTVNKRQTMTIDDRKNDKVAEE